MPPSALTRALATAGIVVALVSATLAAPSAQAADERRSADTSSRKATMALSSARTALAGRGGDATMALRDLWLQRDSLSAADQASYAKLAERPVKPSTLDAGNIRVHYDALEMTPSFTAQNVLDATVAVSNLYTSSGYRQPLPDGVLGGTAATDIYVDSLPGGLYGYCTTDQQQQTGPGRYDVWAYCVVDNDYAGFPTNTPLENLLVTVAHEYYHATQFAYDVADDGWAMEATAAWVEDEVFDDIDDNVQYLADSPITDRKRSMDKFGDLFHYGVWIYFRYLSEKFPERTGSLPTIILKMWEGADSSKGAKKDQYFTQSMVEVLKNKPYKSSFEEEFTRFSDANRRAPVVYSEGTTNAYPSAKVKGRKTLNKGKSKTFTAKLDHMSSSTFQFTPKSKAKKLKLSISGAPKSEGTRAVVSVYQTNGKVKTKLVLINAKGIGSFKAPFKAKKVVAVEVTLVNASTRFADCYERQTDFSCSGKPLDENNVVKVIAQAV